MTALAWAAPTTRNFGIWLANGWLTRAPTSGLRCSSLMKAGCGRVLVTAGFPTHGEVTAAPSWNAESRTKAGMIARRRIRIAKKPPACSLLDEQLHGDVATRPESVGVNGGSAAEGMNAAPAVHHPALWLGGGARR